MNPGDDCMDDFKSKRKNSPRTPYVFLAVGIAIGVLVMAALYMLLPFLDYLETIRAEPTPIVEDANAMNLMPTPAPTVDAPRVQAAAVSPDGRYLITTASDNAGVQIILTELTTEGELSGVESILYQAVGSNFDDLLFSPDGSKLVATINYGIAILFDVKTQAKLGEYPNIGGAAFNADGSILALVGANNGIRLIDTRSLTLLDSTEHDAYQVGAVAISSQNQLAIALDNRVEVYALNNLAQAPDVYEVDSNFAYDLAFHPSGDYLAVSGDGIVLMLNLDNTSQRQIFNFTTPYIHALAFSPSGEWLAVAGGESGYATSLLTVFRWDNSNVLHPEPNYYTPISLEGHEHTVFDVAFTPDDYLLSASWDGTVRLWDLNTHEEISRLQH
jgi:WD40 repeat protein